MRVRYCGGGSRNLLDSKCANLKRTKKIVHNMHVVRNVYWREGLSMKNAMVNDSIGRCAHTSSAVYNKHYVSCLCRLAGHTSRVI